MKSRKAQVGSGRVYKEISSDPIEGATMVPVRESDGPDREGFTRKRFTQLAAPTDFAKNMAGGSRTRNEELRQQSQNAPKPQSGGSWDSLPGEDETLSLNKAQREGK